MELSINAIVVLIIAIAMLGVGIFFIKEVVGGEITKLPTLTNDIKEQIKEQVRTTNSKLFLSGLDGQTLNVPLKKSNDAMVVAVGNQEQTELIYTVVLRLVKKSDGNVPTPITERDLSDPVLRIPFSELTQRERCRVRTDKFQVAWRQGQRDMEGNSLQMCVDRIQLYCNCM